MASGSRSTEVERDRMRAHVADSSQEILEAHVGGVLAHGGLDALGVTGSATAYRQLKSAGSESHLVQQRTPATLSS